MPSAFHRLLQSRAFWLCIGLCGCGDPNPNLPKLETKPKPASTDEAMPVEDTSPEAIERALNELTSSQREEAEQQKKCPVTDLPLGAMGVPTTIEHDGHTIFLCCRHCDRLFKKYPKKYLAKIEEWLHPSENTESSDDPLAPGQGPTVPQPKAF